MLGAKASGSGGEQKCPPAHKRCRTALGGRKKKKKTTCQSRSWPVCDSFIHGTWIRVGIYISCYPPRIYIHTIITNGRLLNRQTKILQDHTRREVVRRIQYDMDKYPKLANSAQFQVLTHAELLSFVLVFLFFFLTLL